jgi:hypothetical protein
MYTKSPTKTRAGYNAYINHGDLFGGSSLPRALDRPWPEYLNRFSSCRTIARRGNQFGGLKVDPLTNDAPEAAEELMRQAYARLPHHFSSTKRQRCVPFNRVSPLRRQILNGLCPARFSPHLSSGRASRRAAYEYTLEEVSAGAGASIPADPAWAQWVFRSIYNRTWTLYRVDPFNLNSNSLET